MGMLDQECPILYLKAGLRGCRVVLQQSVKNMPNQELFDCSQKLLNHEMRLIGWIVPIGVYLRSFNSQVSSVSPPAVASSARDAVNVADRSRIGLFRREE